MIFDHIKNIDRYKSLSADIYAGLEFISKLNPDTAEGEYKITENAKADISSYTTKVENPNGFENHEKYIDIQYLLSGSEKIACEQRENLCQRTEYNPEKDITFYNHADSGISLTLGNGYFAILFPNDAHEPQLCTNKPEIVKKVVVKVLCK